MPISLYRKWRPQKFSDIVNQSAIIQTLEGALLNNRIVHAYLFTGPRGTGKTSVARLLAKAVNCVNKKTFEPCNKCESCKEITEGRSLDIFEIDAASHRGIDEIRDLIEKIKFTPNKSKYKVFVIDETHMLTKEAFNALLKTLEEPPSHAIFILATTEPHKVPPTILSRCQRYDFRRISITEIEKQIEKIAKEEKIKIDEGGVALISQNSEGSMRDAIGFLDQLRALTKNKITLKDVEYILGITSHKAVLKFLDLIFKREVKESVELINKIFDKGYELPQLIKNLIEEIRKIILIKSGIDIRTLGLEEEEEKKIQKWADMAGLGQLLNMIKVFRDAEENLKFVSMPQLALEMAIVEIIKPEENSETNSKFQITNSKQISNLKFQKDSKKENKPKNKTEIKTTERLIKIWPQIIENIKKENSSLSAFLKLCVPLEIKNDKIILGAEFKLHLDKINQKKEIIENILKECCGTHYSIRCEKISKENQENYRMNLKKIQEAEKNIEKDLEKNTFEVFGE